MKDVISSMCVGVGQLIVGHPFDTIKVHIQNKKPLPHVSLTNYYKGWKFPLLHGLFYNITCFTIHERNYKYTNSHFISGMLGGLCVSPLTYISDTFKIKYQTSKPKISSLPARDNFSSNANSCSNSNSLKPVIKQAFSQIKTRNGLYSLTCRETLASGIYFSTFHTLKTYIDSSLICGGLTGVASWTITYPIDVIMSRQIAQNISISAALQQKKLWKGYKVCIQRALIVNAINFKIYDTLMNGDYLSFLDEN